MRLVLAGVFASIAAAGAQPLDGVWQSRGYGYVFTIKGESLEEFEITKTTCVRGFNAQRQRTSGADWEAAFKSKDEGVFSIRAGGVDNYRLLHPDYSVPDIQLDRISALPAICAPPTANTPLDNFEVFARTWAENYISFDLRHTDWDKVVAANRPKITAQTTPAQLFEILEAMIKPLGDLHTGIEARTLKRSTDDFFRQGTDRVIKAKRGRQHLIALTNRAYLQGPLRMFCNGQIQYGHIDDSIGYLRILSFNGYARHDDMKALETALDAIFSGPKLRALVIDVRLSFGGSDELGLAIARRLATSEYLAYAVQARNDPVDRNHWSPSDRILVRPGSRPGFRGPVVELIGPVTMSAAETFTQALMGRNPHVTRIGESTQGVFCDVLDRHLPNGWKFGLPNAVYRTAEGIAFDVRGIPPDVEVPVFADADVTSGKDSAMAKAIGIIADAR